MMKIWIVSYLHGDCDFSFSSALLKLYRKAAAMFFGRDFANVGISSEIERPDVATVTDEMEVFGLGSKISGIKDFWLQVNTQKTCDKVRQSLDVSIEEHSWYYVCYESLNGDKTGLPFQWLENAVVFYRMWGPSYFSDVHNSAVVCSHWNRLLSTGRSNLHQIVERGGHYRYPLVQDSTIHH